MKLVKVIWEDAASMDSWQDLEDYDMGDDYIVETIGFLVKKTNKHITVVSQVCHSHDKATHFMKIPRETVRKIIELKHKGK